MKKNGIIARLMILLSFYLPLGLFAQELQASDQNKIRIGILGMLTGPGSEVGLLNLRGANLAADWINHKGGMTIKGQKYFIELIVEDGTIFVDRTITAVTRLIEFHKVKFISGGVPPNIIMAAGTVTEPSGVLRSVWWGEGSPPELNSKTPYTFRANTGTRDTFAGVYKYLAEAYPKVKTVALLNPDSPSSPFMFDMASKEAEISGLKVIYSDNYPRDTKDYYPLLTKVLASKPDSIGNTGGFPMQVGGIMKTARELGFNGPVFGWTPASIEEIRDIVGKELAMDWFNACPVVDSPEMTPMIKIIRKMALDKYKNFNLDYLIGWDGVWCLAQAIEEAQTLDPFVVARSWEKMSKIETAYGIGKMGGIKTYGINHVVVKPFPISRMVNGKVEHAKWISPEIP